MARAKFERQAARHMELRSRRPRQTTLPRDHKRASIKGFLQKAAIDEIDALLKEKARASR